MITFFLIFFNSYGSIAGIVVVAVLAVLVMFIFGALLNKKMNLAWLWDSVVE